MKSIREVGESDWAIASGKLKELSVKTRKQSQQIPLLLIKLYLPQTTHLLCENYSVNLAVARRWSGPYLIDAGR